MVQSPDDKGCPSAMPEPGRKKDNQQINIRPHLPFPVAAQRDVDVLAEPGGQADVPPPPESVTVRDS